MPGKRFLDTNILIYAHDLDAGRRHDVAASLVAELWETGQGVLSIQVLQEFYVNITRKIPQPLTPSIARGLIENYCAWEVMTPEVQDVLRASEVQERNSLSFWDAMIIVSASKAGADIVISEDLNAGQCIEGVLVRNPFVSQNKT
ncbi:PIN domain-containing protein [Desulfonatronum sp. SC1]|uniref:PIN domain-containing protein n=1 Tax=Desulfonatronum sp. SC1 TaxID=2109626 RepID=UPI000D2F4CB7|nr:PIN domain-containing protein [Desulfonatronum sp. SC1]PTN37189.1 PIN domain nuclease [Desulfonatronum sp. SC1]